MKVIFKYIGYGLMILFLGIIGVGVFLFYIIKKMLGNEEMLEVETDDWCDEEDRQPNAL